VKPSWRPLYQTLEDSILITRGDTNSPTTKEQSSRIASYRAQQKADSAKLDLRFNWETPYFLSPHNADVFYIGGNRVLKSTQRGDNLYPISPDLSKGNLGRIDTSMNKTGGITLDATGAETYGTVVALSESYVRPGFLYAGTDDGNVWTTENDGSSWQQIPTTRFAGLPTGDVYVSRIEPSHFDTTTFYITFDNHRWNDFTPYVYVTNDAGKTFRSIAGGLPHDSPADFVHVVREDPYNRDLLYVGTSRSAYVSLDRGTSWHKFNGGLPTVPVYDLKIHPRDRELIAATHGRGIWIVDVAALEQMAGDSGKRVVADNAYLFASPTAFEYGQGPAIGASSNGEGQKFFNAPSPQYGAEIVYRIAPGSGMAAAQAGNANDANGSAPSGGRGGRAPREQARIVITDARGDTVRTLNGPMTAGLHRVTWDFRGKAAPRAPLSISQRRDSIVQANRMNFVFDSLEKAGTMPKAQLDRIRQMIASGNPGFGRGGGGGGRGGAGGGWVARPGEGAFVGAGARGGAAQGEGGQGGEENIQDMLAAFPGGAQEFGDLLRPPGQRGGRGGGGGFGNLFGFGGGGRGAGQAPVVNTGDYLVTLTVGGRTYKQVLRVERMSGGDDTGFNFGSDDDHDPKK
jgi:hypothetical protein